MNMFDSVSPSYGRPKMPQDGPLVRPTSQRRDEPRTILAGERDELAAITARRVFLKKTRGGCLTGDQPLRLVDNRPPRFVNCARITWA
jgi:hypothetical protein